MRFTLKCLHHNGVVLTPEQLADAPSHTGNLVVGAWTPASTFHRSIPQARLLDASITREPIDIIPPLFDPELVQMTDEQMRLQGYQIHVDAGCGVIHHFTQVWVLCLAADL